MIILSLGINAFTQQALRSVPCQVDDPTQKASISIAQSALDGTYFAIRRGPGKSWLNTVDVGMKTAFIGGLTDVDLASVPPFTCPSGNCSFPAYGGITHSTITFEVECHDISSQIVQFDHGEHSTDYMIPAGPTLTYNWTLDTAIHSTGWDIPLQWSTYYNATVRGSRHDGFAYPKGVPFYFMMPTTSNCQDVTKFPDYRQGNPDPLPRVDAKSCASSPYTANVSTLPGFYGLTAGACDLYPSLQRYHGAVVKGRLSEYSISGPPVPLEYLGDESAETDLFRIDEGSKKSYYWTFLDPCYIDGDVYTSSNFSTAPGKLVNIMDRNNMAHTGPEECFYGLSYHWHNVLHVLMTEIFYGDSCEATTNETSIICDNWWLNALWNERNSSFSSTHTAINRATKAMTNRLRAIGTDWQGTRTSVTGTVLQTDICVAFEWQWLLFPGTIAFVTTVMFVMVIVKSAQMADKWGVWKSSVLPFLIYGVEEESKTPGHMGETGIVEHAKATPVLFEGNRDRWRFRFTRD